MSPNALMLVIAGLTIVNFVWSVRIGAQLGFYRGYFNEKQRLRGKDPRESIRQEFPAVLYYLIFWGPK